MAWKTIGLLMLCVTSVAARVALVLGSGGLIGARVTQQLKAHDWQVLEVTGRNHIDLRKPHALDVFE
jgi:hypothetical protein